MNKKWLLITTVFVSSATQITYCAEGFEESPANESNSPSASQTESIVPLAIMTGGSQSLSKTTAPTFDSTVNAASTNMPPPQEQSISLKQPTQAAELEKPAEIESMAKPLVEKQEQAALNKVPAQEKIKAPNVRAKITKAGNDLFDATTKTFIEILNQMVKNALEYKFNKKLRNYSPTQVVTTIITNTLRHMLNEMLHVSENIKNPKQKQNITALKKQIQYILQKVEKYNDTQTYQNFDEMLNVIQACNKFLQESQSVPFSKDMDTSMRNGYSLAQQSVNICKPQNIVFSPNFTPQPVLTFFQPTIKNIDTLATQDSDYTIVHTVYDKDGLMNQILNDYSTFTKSKNTAPENYFYAAFTTLLLIFENSIIACTAVLNETSSLYKVVQTPLQVTVPKSNAS